jgi:multiple sugar transport system permease protein
MPNAANRKRPMPGLYMVIPVIGIMLLSYFIFLIFPIGYAIVGSLYDWNPLKNLFNFIGIGNYIEALTYKLTWTSLFNSMFFTIFVVLVRTIIGLVFAVLINNVLHFRSFFRTVYFLPVVTSMVAVSLVWAKLLYNPAFGIINQMLQIVGIPGLMWLRSSATALMSIMIMTIWKDAGYAVVLYLAGLQTIPAQLLEAATIDGAGRFKSFWHVTLPLLNGTTLLVLITSTISYLQAFTQIFMMTGDGGPGTSTHTMVFYLYREAFVKYRFGYASALSVILFVIILVLSLAQLKLTRKDD